MKIAANLNFRDILTIFLGIYLLNNSKLNFRTSLVKGIDALYWGLYWLEGIEEYNHNMGYMQGNWAPVSTQLEQHQVEIDGELPGDLVGGMFVRMGANTICWPPTGVHHAFNGEAMIHMVTIKDGETLEYTNSLIDSKPEDRLNAFSNETCLGNSCGVPYFGFGDLNRGGFALLRLLLVKLRAKIMNLNTPTQERLQPGSTSLITHANKTYTASEIVLPFEISLEKDGVSPKGFSTFDGLLANQTFGPEEGTMSAHPRTDPTTGELLFFSANFGSGAVPFVNFGNLDADGLPKKYIQIPVPSPPAAFYHDMFLTKNYAVFFHSSLKKDLSRLAKMETLTYFDSNSNLAFGVLPRNATSHEDLIWIEAPNPGHIWHTIGAREDGDQLTLFAPKFENYSNDVRIHLDTEESSYLTKFVLNLKTKECTEQIIFDEVVERPTVNPNVMSPTFAYLRSEGKESSEMGRHIVKFNLITEEAEGVIECGVNCHFGESLFVPRVNSSLEDDGYLMDIPYYKDTHSSRFLVWDTLRLETGVIASAELPQRVPYGAHGKWLESSFFQ